jgi:TonB family protein
MDMGTYTFSLMDDKGVTSDVAARYTFIYQYRDGAWKILHHHSSAMPESGAVAAPVEAHAAAEKPPAVPKPAQTVRAAPMPPPVPDRPKVAAKDPPKPAVPATPVAAKSTAAKPTEAQKAEAKTAMFANLTSSPPPSKFYPPEAAKKKERGNVNLKVCADDTGAMAGTPEVLKSSGSALLDEAALSWARAAKWVPATLNSRRVEGCTQIDVAFEAAA